MEDRELKDKQIVIPGECLGKIRGGTGTFEENGKTFSKYLGMIRLKDSIVNVIPLSGVYIPKVDDGVIALVDDLQNNFWILDINSPYDAIMPLSEAVSEYVDLGKTDITRYFNIGDIIYAKISRVTKVKDIQVSMNSHKARKLHGGRLVLISPTKVSRLIGKEGSMIEMIKESTGCQIVVGQNGVVWLNGENEDLAIKAIMMIQNKSHLDGLTEKIAELLKKV